MGVACDFTTPTSSDDVKHVPEKLQTYRLEKKYYEATELLKNAGRVYVQLQLQQLVRCS